MSRFSELIEGSNIYFEFRCINYQVLCVDVTYIVHYEIILLILVQEKNYYHCDNLFKIILFSLHYKCEFYIHD